MSFASSLSSNLRRVPAEREPAPGFGRAAIVAHVDRWFAVTGSAPDVRAALVVIDVDIDDALPTGDEPFAIGRPAADDGLPVADGPAPADGPAAADGFPVASRSSAHDGGSAVGGSRADMPFPGATPFAADAVVVRRDVDVPPNDDVESVEDVEAETRRRRLGRSVERAVSAHVRPGDAVARVDAGRFAILRGALPEGRSARAEAAALARCIEDGLVGRPEGYGVRVTVGAATLRAGGSRDGRQTLGSVTTAMLEGKLLTDDRVVVVVAAGG